MDAYTTVQPQQNLLLGIIYRGGREEPEEQLIGVVGVVADGEIPRVGLADVEVDVRDLGAVDGEFCLVTKTF